MLSTYRFRLIAYTFLLVTFLTATLAYTYFYSRDVILEEAENSVTNTALLLNSNLELEESELLHYAEIVRDDLRVKEYMFMVVKVGTDSEPLEALYNRHFGWLPVARRTIITNSGRPLLGDEHSDLISEFQQHLATSKEQVFYIRANDGLEMVTWAAVSYQGASLGYVILTHALNRKWIYEKRQYNSGYLFIEQNGTVLLSNLPGTDNMPFKLKNGLLELNNEQYQIRPIILSGNTSNAPRLWHGMSMRELLAKLERHSRIVLTLTLSGSLAILWTGLIIVRNFNNPLTELVHIARSVAQGNLPSMNKSEQKNEITVLSNQFADMLQALRDKQEEIDRVHKELEESAITDSLTRLYNRRHLQEVFPRILGQAQREHLYLAGIIFDLDYFKQINDKYGHLGGDQCLMQFSQLLRDTSRANDYIFRIGGEEFLLLSINDSQDSGRLLADKIRVALENHPIAFKDHVVKLTTSVGISHADTSLSPDEALSTVLYNADQALYKAKANGRNQVHVYAGGNDKSKTVWDYVS